MLDDTKTVPSDAGETVVEDTASAPLENITSSPEVKDTEVQVSVPEQDKSSEIDYLKELDSLQLDPAKKELLKAGYLRQADYTRKTQELAKDRGTLEQYRQVQPVIEFLNKNPDLFNEVVGKMQGTQPQGQEEIPQDPKEYADWLEARMFQKLETRKVQEADFQSAAKVDPRLDSDSEFGDTIAKIVASDSEYRSGQISATEATKKAVANFDKYIAKAINTAKLTMSEKAKLKKSGSTVPSSSGHVGGGTQPMTIEEAAKQAEDELAS